MDLRNKNVIYVGGFGGIGYAACKCFLEQNIKCLAIFDFQEDPQRLQELQSIATNEADVFSIKVDVTDRANVEAAFAKAHSKMGHFDVVVNGSGFINEHCIEQTVNVNLLGVIYLCLAALPYMDKSQGGHGGLIVNIASVLGLEANGTVAVYTATKHGVCGFTKALANPFYYERTQVGFITICPGGTDTFMIQNMRLIKAHTFNQRPPLTQPFLTMQTAQECAQQLIETVKMAKNGSIWIITGGKLNEVFAPKYLFE